MKFLMIVLCCNIFFVTPVVCSNTFNLKDLKESYNRADIAKVVEMLELSKSKMYDSSVSNYVMDLWRIELEDNGKNREGLKISLADFLSQALYNGLIEMEYEPILAQARLLIDSSDKKVIGKAVSILARGGVQTDLEMVFNVLSDNVVSRSSYLFRSSVLAILRTCDEQMIDALFEIENLNGSQRDFIVETSEHFEELGYC